MRNYTSTVLKVDISRSNFLSIMDMDSTDTLFWIRSKKIQRTDFSELQWFKNSPVVTILKIAQSSGQM